MVTDYNHLCHLCRYIHANPVKHGLVNHLLDWDYSNYAEWLGLRPGTLVDKTFIQDHFPNPGEYKAFVHDYLPTNNLPDDMDDDLFH